jgi:rare lipoprotein A
MDCQSSDLRYGWVQSFQVHSVNDRLLLLLLIAAPAVGSPSREEFVVEQVTHQSQPIAEQIQPKSSLKPIFQESYLQEHNHPALNLKHLGVGVASWYGPGFYGRRTANGEILRKGTLTAAHRTLPFGTIVRVTNLENGKSVNVRINDRGPFKYHRVIDLAHGAASELRMMRAGEIKVNLEVID